MILYFKKFLNQLYKVKIFLIFHCNSIKKNKNLIEKIIIQRYIRPNSKFF
jgi:hypothetical protein